MPVIPVQYKFRYIQYDGTNSSEMNDEVGMTIISEADGVLVAQIPADGQQYTINTGYYIIYFENAVIEIDGSDFEFERRWRCTPTCDVVEEVASLVQEVTTSPFVRAMGIAPVPTLPLGQDVTVAVQIQPAMPDSGYTAYAAVFGGINVGDLSITSVSVVDTDTVNVAVDNGGLGTVSGVTLMVHAID